MKSLEFQLTPKAQKKLQFSWKNRERTAHIPGEEFWLPICDTRTQPVGTHLHANYHDTGPNQVFKLSKSPPYANLKI
jgi:hypothetical protein